MAGWPLMNRCFFRPLLCSPFPKKVFMLLKKENPQLESCIKTLLRAYEGIFDQVTAISEKVIAGLMRMPVDDVKAQLLLLNRAGIIEYQPQKDTPQLLMLRSRDKKQKTYLLIWLLITNGKKDSACA